MKKIIIIAIIIVLALSAILCYLLINNDQEPVHAFQRWRNDVNIGNLYKEYTGKGVTVAIIDTGVDVNHPDLEKANITCIDNTASDSELNNYEHGTAMAGIISAYPASEDGLLGIAPEVNIVSIDFSDKNSDDVDRLITGIEKAIECEVDIINISMGVDYDSTELHKVIIEAYNRDIIIVAAAGNGDNGKALYPAKYDEVISVGALDKDGSILYKDLSIEDITVLAPGRNILTTYSSEQRKDKYISADGSSPATAIVSGIIALLKEKKPDITITQLLEFFKDNQIIDALKLINYFK